MQGKHQQLHFTCFAELTSGTIYTMKMSEFLTICGNFQNIKILDSTILHKFLEFWFPNGENQNLINYNAVVNISQRFKSDTSSNTEPKVGAL